MINEKKTLSDIVHLITIENPNKRRQRQGMNMKETNDRPENLPEIPVLDKEMLVDSQELLEILNVTDAIPGEKGWYVRITVKREDQTKGIIFASFDSALDKPDWIGRSATIRRRQSEANPKQSYFVWGPPPRKAKPWDEPEDIE